MLLAGRPFVILPRSAGGGITYRYVLEGDGFKLYIHSNPSNTIQPVRVRYMTEGLIGRDLFAKHAELLELLHDMGFSVTQEKISRVDLQVMLYRDVMDFMKPILSGNSVCVARKGQFNTSGDRILTYRLGRGGQQACIYDKRTELFETKQANEAKFWLMVNECFGEEWLYEEIPTTRVEFRIKREVLKDMGINSMHDLLEHEAGLARYCYCSRFRILSDAKQKATRTSRKSPRSGVRSSYRSKNGFRAWTATGWT
ncbi:MAG TPA: hypothetical protein DEB39_06460 [Planctomycetaceae bacterium]|nr:hypothetical protein [Planctomycetaceae bacterium]